MTPHKRTRSPERDHWCTPQPVEDALQRFWRKRGGTQLDPCSNPKSIVTAQWRIMLAAPKNVPSMNASPGPGIILGDGLSYKWMDRTYCNPIYSAPAPWVAAMRKYGEQGLEIVGCLRCDPSVEWFQDVWSATAICFGRSRWMFIPPPGVEPSSNNGANAIPYWGHDWAGFEEAFAPLGKIVFPNARPVSSASALDEIYTRLQLPGPWGPQEGDKQTQALTEIKRLHACTNALPYDPFAHSRDP